MPLLKPTEKPLTCTSDHSRASGQALNLFLERANAKGVDNSVTGIHTFHMSISELLEEEQVLAKIACSSKDDLICKLLDLVFKTKDCLPFSREEALNTINIREKIGGTLFPSGLSVPHARLRNYDGFILVIGTPEKELFHEGLQVRMMALMITSQVGAPHYLPALAELTKISKNSEFYSRLCDAETPKDFISIFREQVPE